MQKLTALSKFLILGILVGSGVTAYRTYGGMLQAGAETPRSQTSLAAASAEPAFSARSLGATAAGSVAKSVPLKDRPVRVALSQWPGHMALVVGAGGLR